MSSKQRKTRASEVSLLCQQIRRSNLLALMAIQRLLRSLFFSPLMTQRDMADLASLLRDMETSGARLDQLCRDGEK